MRHGGWLSSFCPHAPRKIEDEELKNHGTICSKIEGNWRQITFILVNKVDGQSRLPVCLPENCQFFIKKRVGSVKKEINHGFIIRNRQNRGRARILTSVELRSPPPPQGRDRACMAPVLAKKPPPPCKMWRLVLICRFSCFQAIRRKCSR